MKQSWTRLEQIVRKKGGDQRFMDPQFQNLFIRHHKNACEIVCNRTGQPLAAVYFSPIGKHQTFVKDVMREIQRRSQYSGDSDE